MQAVGITPELLERYDTRAPRYTSYPTAPQWTESFTRETFAGHLRQLSPGPCDIALYVHVPFCHQRCTFCGCNVVIDKKHELSDSYLDLIAREADLILAQIPKSTQLRLQQLHWGGGTPNYLYPEQMARLHKIIADRFPFLPGAELALEMDPRHISLEHVRTLAGLGFNRVSLGIQDTNEQVQEAINRIHSPDVVLQGITWLREAGFQGLNIDLIYGLPFQTLESWQRTLEDMALFKPDRVAMYGFAYLPGKMKQQKYMDEEHLPDSSQRFEQFLAGLKWFTSHDYMYIGIDHFARESDELAIACRNHTLQRTFMGYTTLAGTEMISLGSSSISHLKSCFSQNDKHLAAYERAIQAGQLPIERGLSLSPDDRIRDRVIQELMCFSALSMDVIEREFGIDFKTYFADELARLRPLEQDGLVKIGDRTLETSLLGHILLRNVASIFDAYLRPAAAGGHATTYSKTI